LNIAREYIGFASFVAVFVDQSLKEMCFAAYALALRRLPPDKQ